MKAPRTTTVAAAVLFVAGSALAQAQGTYTPPPRTVQDILAVFDEYKPDPARVTELRARAAEVPPSDADLNALARFYLRRGQSARLLGDSRQARDDLTRAHELAKSAGIESGAFVAARASMENWSGNDLVAIQVRAEWFARLPGRQWGERLSQATVLTSYARWLGDRASAKKWHTEAERAFEDARNAPDWNVLHHFATKNVEAARAHVFQLEGRLDLAAAAFVKALEELEADVIRIEGDAASKGQATDTAWYHVNRIWFGRELARTQAAQGRLAESESTLRDLLHAQLRRLGRASAEVASLTSGLAFNLGEQGRFTEAGLLYGASLDSYERGGAVAESRNPTTQLRNLAQIRAYEGRWREADESFRRRALLVAQDPVLAKITGRNDFVWGLVLAKLGRAEEALAMLGGIVKARIRDWGESDYGTLERRGFLAIALASAGKKPAALREFGSVVPQLLEQARGDGSTDAVSATRRVRMLWILESYLGLLAELRGLPVVQEAGIDAVSASFAIADFARGSAVQRALGAVAARTSAADPQLAELARREQDAQQQIAVLSDALTRLLGASAEARAPKIINEVGTELKRLREERKQLWAQITARFPAYANLLNPRPPTLDEARAALKDGEALISLYVTDDRTYVWAIPKRGAPVFGDVPLGEQALGEIVARLRKALDVGDAVISQFPKFDVGAAYKLYSELLAPVEAGWKDATSLLVVPHRALGQLPFGILVTALTQAPGDAGTRFGGYQQVPWLIRKAAITQLPSVNALVTLRATPPPSAERRAFAGFGDPYFSREQQAQADRQGVTNVAMPTRGIALRNLAIAKVALPAPPGIDQPSAVMRNAPVIANSSTLAQLARLPETADEIREIAQALQADPTSDVFLGVAANEKNVKTVDLSNRKVIAFATHGLVPGDLNGLEQPALALSAPEVAGIDGDGLLTMDEILGLKLNADWIVLSACNTASGDGAGAEAVSGLGRAFFYAGARALLVSNWPVETRSARLLTTGLFKRQSENPNLTRAEALRQTMLGLMDNEGQRDAAGKLQFSYAHPLFWAPFSLVGDGGSK